jgi:hypothetical protein
VTEENYETHVGIAGVPAEFEPITSRIPATLTGLFFATRTDVPVDHRSKLNREGKKVRKRMNKKEK